MRTHDRKMRFGVTDGPSGSRWVQVPPDPAVAINLRSKAGGRFWCSAAAGGCGNPLKLRVGDVNRPHFAHRSGEGDDCAYRSGPVDGSDDPVVRAARSYLHLAVQEALASWLERQGLSAKMEYTFADKKRADLYVTVEELKHSIEVQLSPISPEVWESRNTCYLQSTDRTTWLLGPQVSGLTLARQAETYGLAMTVGFRELAVADPDRNHDERVDIGVATDGFHGSAPLSAWRFGPQGFEHPMVTEALEVIAARGKEAEHRAQALEEARQRSAEELERSKTYRQAALVATQARSSEVSRSLGDLKHVRNLIRDPWAPSIGWGFLEALDPALHEPARVLAQYVRKIAISGSVSRLSFNDVETQPIVTALVDAGFVELSVTESGIVRWRRVAR